MAAGGGAGARFHSDRDSTLLPRPAGSVPHRPDANSVPVDVAGGKSHLHDPCPHPGVPPGQAGRGRNRLLGGPDHTARLVRSADGRDVGRRLAHRHHGRTRRRSPPGDPASRHDVRSDIRRRLRGRLHICPADPAAIWLRGHLLRSRQPDRPAGSSDGHGAPGIDGGGLRDRQSHHEPCRSRDAERGRPPGPDLRRLGPHRP